MNRNTANDLLIAIGRLEILCDFETSILDRLPLKVTHIPKERVPSSRRACCSAAVGDVQAAAVRCDAVGVAVRDGLGRQGVTTGRGLSGARKT